MIVLDRVKLLWLYGVSVLFIALNIIFIVNENFWFPVVPIILLIITFAIFSIDILMFIVVFFTPLAINLKNSEFNVGLSLPVEPLMFGIMLIFFIKLFYERKFDKRIINHPVTIAIMFNLFLFFFFFFNNNYLHFFFFLI